MFAGTGALLLAFALTTKADIVAPPQLNTIVENLLLAVCPLNGAIGNSVIIFTAFLVSIPGVISSTSRGFLKFQGCLVVLSGTYTLILGLYLWFTTLKTRANLSVIWNNQPAATQSLLQQSLVCCGFFNSTSPPFVVDSVCPTAAIAATQIGCVTPYTSFANSFLDTIFTAAFGCVGIDVALILGIAILVKDRHEKERYRHIDEKNGSRAF